MIGHGLGAAGGLEAIATIKAINTGWLHPTINQNVLHLIPRFLIFICVILANSNGFLMHFMFIYFYFFCRTWSLMLQSTLSQT